MILITGATGTVGSEAITVLLPAQAGHIRVFTLNPGAVFPDGTARVRAGSLAWRQADGAGLGSASGLGPSSGRAAGRGLADPRRSSAAGLVRGLPAYHPGAPRPRTGTSTRSIAVADMGARDHRGLEPGGGKRSAAPLRPDRPRPARARRQGRLRRRCAMGFAHPGLRSLPRDLAGCRVAPAGWRPAGGPAAVPAGRLPVSLHSWLRDGIELACISCAGGTPWATRSGAGRRMGRTGSGRGP
jgi:hypothetical protein